MARHKEGNSASHADTDQRGKAALQPLDLSAWRALAK